MPQWNKIYQALDTHNIYTFFGLPIEFVDSVGHYWPYSVTNDWRSRHILTKTYRHVFMELVNYHSCA